MQCEYVRVSPEHVTRISCIALQDMAEILITNTRVECRYLQQIKSPELRVCQDKVKCP